MTMALTSYSMPADRRKPPSHKKASGRREDCWMQQEQPEDEKREAHNGKTRDGPYHTNRWYDPSRDIIVSVIVLYYQPCRHSSSSRHNVFFLTIQAWLEASPQPACRIMSSAESVLPLCALTSRYGSCGISPAQTFRIS